MSKAPQIPVPPLTPKEIQAVQTMAGLGLTVEKMAAILGMSKATMERRVRKDAALRDALSKGRAMAEHNVASTAYEMAISGKVPVMTIFFLKCRAGWKDTSVQEIVGKDGKALIPGGANNVVVYIPDNGRGDDKAKK